MKIPCWLRRFAGVVVGSLAMVAGLAALCASVVLVTWAAYNIADWLLPEGAINWFEIGAVIVGLLVVVGLLIAGGAEWSRGWQWTHCRRAPRDTREVEAQ